MDPTASDMALSINGIQCAPPSSVRHTPPWAAPKKAIWSLVGSTAIEVTRPDTATCGESSKLATGAGPIGCQTG